MAEAVLTREELLELLGSGQLALRRAPTLPVEQIRKELEALGSEDGMDMPALRALLTIAKHGSLRSPDIERRAPISHSTWYTHVRRRLQELGLIELEDGYFKLSDKLAGLRSLYER